MSFITQTFLFDIDGTLLDAGGAGRTAMNRALEAAFGIRASVPLVFGGRTDYSLLRELMASHCIEINETAYQTLRDTFVRLMPEDLSAVRGQVLPGVEPLLVHLRTLPTVRLWCMTGNLAETAVLKLKHFGLDHFFDHIVGGDHDDDRCDLARRAQSLLMSRYGDPAGKNITIIGDTLADIACARAIGARVVACCTGFHNRAELMAAEPCALIDDFTSTAEAISLLLPST